MIRVNISETFPITVSLIDESSGTAATGRTVLYDIRQQPNDVSLVPTKTGILTESTVEPGIYTKMETIDTAGTYLIYATCSGFLSNTEEVIVSPDYNRHYNTSVEDVIRTAIIPNASQAIRNVGLGKTDYIITRIKPDSAADWTHPATVSGFVYAHYREMDEDNPFLMGGSGV
jgi:hypothetical protein